MFSLVQKVIFKVKKIEFHLFFDLNNHISPKPVILPRAHAATNHRLDIKMADMKAPQQSDHTIVVSYKGGKLTVVISR